MLGEAGEELEQRVGILRGGRSEPERRPVAEDDVGRAGPQLRCGGAHAATACSWHCCEPRTTSTGHGAEWTSPVETLPEKSRFAAPQPWEPTTISCASYSPAIAADLLDGEAVGNDCGTRRLPPRRPPRPSLEAPHTMTLGLRQLGDDVRVAVAGVPDRGQRRDARRRRRAAGASSRCASSNASFCASSADGEPSVANRIGLLVVISVLLLRMLRTVFARAEVTASGGGPQPAAENPHGKRAAPDERAALLPGGD